MCFFLHPRALWLGSVEVWAVGKALCCLLFWARWASHQCLSSMLSCFSVTSSSQDAVLCSKCGFALGDLGCEKQRFMLLCAPPTPCCCAADDFAGGSRRRRRRLRLRLPTSLDPQWLTEGEHPVWKPARPRKVRLCAMVLPNGSREMCDLSLISIPPASRFLPQICSCAGSLLSPPRPRRAAVRRHDRGTEKEKPCFHFHQFLLQTEQRTSSREREGCLINDEEGKTVVCYTINMKKIKQRLY